ncbi:MAG: hypothetical protein AAF653_19115, partial [Chloroflexota bacterium]
MLMIAIGMMSVSDTELAYAEDDGIKFDCLQSFDYFAYAIQEDLTRDDELDISWIPQYEFPETNEKGDRIYHFNRVLFSRTVNGGQEIWLELGSTPRLYDEPVFGIYHVSD